MNDPHIRRQRLQWVLTPASGRVRVPIWEPCQVRIGESPRDADVWNLSQLGLYLAIDSPPSVGEELHLTFRLDAGQAPIVCTATVAWRNPPSLVIEGLGAVALGLPPGCGVRFVALEEQDRIRIEARLRRCIDGV